MSRRDAVLELKLILLNELKNKWGMSWSDVSKVFLTYNIFAYIDVAYEIFNDMGIEGVFLDIEKYIKAQGGVIQ